MLSAMDSTPSREPPDDLNRRLAELNQIGVALSQEKDLNRLLELILIAAKKITNADGGTLYLQQLQSLTLPIQKELVSVLRNTAHGFRLVCTTSVDLEALVDEGKFHDELFYRVASLPVEIQEPPLIRLCRVSKVGVEKSSYQG